MWWRYFVWLVCPFLLGAFLGVLFARGMWRKYALVGLGLLMGFFVVLGIYLTRPREPVPFGCECYMWLGRWWDPGYVILLTAFAYLVYLFGVGVGAWLRPLFERHRTD